MENIWHVLLAFLRLRTSGSDVDSDWSHYGTVTSFHVLVCFLITAPVSRPVGPCPKTKTSSVWCSLIYCPLVAADNKVEIFCFLVCQNTDTVRTSVESTVLPVSVTVSVTVTTVRTTSLWQNCRRIYLLQPRLPEKYLQKYLGPW